MSPLNTQQLIEDFKYQTMHSNLSLNKLYSDLSTEFDYLVNLGEITALEAEFELAIIYQEYIENSV